MFLVGFVSWWFGAGWRAQISRIKNSLAKTNDFFSIPLLLKTFFAPFHQIEADSRGVSIKEKLEALGGRLFSRVFGAFLRFFLIIFGALSLIFVLIFSLIRLIIWPIFPLAPIFGFVLMILIGAPWKII